MLTLSSYMDERSARYKQEALGRVRVALAGSPPNCFYSLLTDLFGYPSEVTAPVSATAPSAGASASASAPPTAPPKSMTSGLLPTDPSLYKTIPDIGSGSEAPGSRSLRPSLPNPYISGAKAILPSSDNKRWSRTGLASEYEPISVNELYKCPFTNCDYQPRQNLDSVCTHVRRHLNVAIQCHFCSKIYWSSEGWLKHTREVHKESKPVPADYGKERAAPRQDILKESMAAYGIALQEERAGLEAAPSLPATDYDLEPEHTMDYQTEETEEDSDIQVVGSE